MRFEEAYDGYQRHRLSVSEAATLLGVCDRTDQRYMYRYEEDGMDGLLDQRLNTPSHLRAPVDEVIALQDLYSSRYQGWNVNIKVHVARVCSQSRFWIFKSVPAKQLA